MNDKKLREKLKYILGMIYLSPPLDKFKIKDISPKLEWQEDQLSILFNEEMGKQLEEFEKLANHQINQESKLYPEYIKGINKAGQKLKELIDNLKSQTKEEEAE